MAESSAPAPAPPRCAASPKVCLFSTCYPLSNRKVRVEDVYVFDIDPNTKRNPNPNLDLDDPDLISVSPALRFEYASYPLARCVVNERLYLFEGSANCEPGENSVHTCALSSSSEAGLEPALTVKIDDMTTCPPMNGLKRSPCAILTPDGERILVFSGVIVQNIPLDEPDYFTDFELYDYVKANWVTLPPLPAVRDDGAELIIGITSYYFLDDSTFVVHTGRRLRCSFALHLNLNGDDAHWERYGEELLPITGITGEVSAHGGGLCVSVSGLYNRLGRFSYLPFPLNPNMKEGLLPQEDYFTGMTVVDHRHGHGDDNNTEVVGICVLTVVFDEIFGASEIRSCTTTYPRVYIDVHDLNPAELQSRDQDDLCTTLPPTKTRSYKFDVSIPYWTFWPIDMRPVGFSRSKRLGLAV